MINRKIEELVEENYINGYVLYYFGIKFYDYFKESLSDVCEGKGIDPHYLIKEMTVVQDQRYSDVEERLSGHSVDLIIAYLKHSHFRFIKRRLPYLAHMVQDFHDYPAELRSLLYDLKLLFPLFAEEFIEHVYEEEDTLFKYINELKRFEDGNLDPASLFYLLDQFAMAKFAEQHKHSENEMEGIRKLTNNYQVQVKNNLQVKVLMYELESFHRELDRHAYIENEILLPKAAILETAVLKQFTRLSKLN